MPRPSFSSLLSPIKILYETSGAEGGWQRAVNHAKTIVHRRERTAYVDYRPSTKTWVVWDWAHHAGPRVVSLTQVQDEIGRYGLTQVDRLGQARVFEPVAAANMRRPAKRASRPAKRSSRRPTRR